MQERRWVCHISGQGEKWETTDDPDNGDTDWEVIGKNGRARHYLPRSEYRLCDPPEVWEDVTAECTVNEYGSIQHNGVNTMVDEGYRRSMVRVSLEAEGVFCKMGWAFIIEKKESA